jgi:hypothetical protein
MPTSPMLSLEPSTLDAIRVSAYRSISSSADLPPTSANPRKLPLDIRRGMGLMGGVPTR